MTTCALLEIGPVLIHTFPLRNEGCHRTPRHRLLAFSTLFNLLYPAGWVIKKSREQLGPCARAIPESNFLIFQWRVPIFIFTTIQSTNSMSKSVKVNVVLLHNNTPHEATLIFTTHPFVSIVRPSKLPGNMSSILPLHGTHAFCPDLW